ncbi:helix-turn-helix domain-containing protein [Desulfovibrio sp. ZJ200]|uniref:helix-turn-helix domain-containing protein n=1 Tax=Desulfovibrio sp. ZJ200 TaxID=2709792 RepID=UPI0013EE33BF|nr:helix-turn-helix domain-containing protein [Desulfovibrio sp. ZJ200]
MEAAFSDAYARILKATGCDGQAELAKELAISPAVISDSRRRGEIRPEILLALLERWGLNPNWIRTGKGRPYFCASPIQIAQMAGRGLFPAAEEQASAPPQTAFSDEQKLACIKLLCTNFDCGRGIWKQIDENRELIQFLFHEFPEVKERASFVEGWIGDTDYFLNCLAEILEVEIPFWARNFPRPWPGRHGDPQKCALKWTDNMRKAIREAENNEKSVNA